MVKHREGKRWEEDSHPLFVKIIRDSGQCLGPHNKGDLASFVHVNISLRLKNINLSEKSIIFTLCLKFDPHIFDMVYYKELFVNIILHSYGKEAF